VEEQLSTAQEFGSVWDFKDTEIGPMPEAWGVVPLRSVVERTGNRDPRKTPDTEFKYIDVSSVSNESYRVESWKICVGSEAPSRARKVVKARDVLFATVRPYLKNIAAIPAHLDEEICSTGFCVIRAKKEVADPDFLYYITISDSFVGSVVAKQRGSSYPAVSDKVVLEEAIPLPPLPEQRRIARVLSTVRRTIEATEAVIAATRELKRSLMHHLFTYGPVSLQEAERVPLKETEIGLVPEGWEWSRLKECAVVQTGVAKGRKFPKEIPTEEVPYLRVANVQDGYLDLSEMKHIRIRVSERERYSLRTNDVVLTEGGDYDKLGRGFIWRGQIPDCVHQNHVFVVRANQRLLRPEFLAYLVQSAYGKAYFLKVAHRTTHLACINSSKLKAFPALLPPKKDQGDIVRILGNVDQKIAAERNRKQALQALFKSLLHNLMTGRVRV